MVVLALEVDTLSAAPALAVKPVELVPACSLHKGRLAVDEQSAHGLRVRSGGRLPESPEVGVPEGRHLSHAAHLVDVQLLLQLLHLEVLKLGLVLQVVPYHQEGRAAGLSPQGVLSLK